MTTWRELLQNIQEEDARRYERDSRTRDWALRAVMARAGGALYVTPEEYMELQDPDFDWPLYDLAVQDLLIQGGEFRDTPMPPLPVVVVRGGDNRADD